MSAVTADLALWYCLPLLFLVLYVAVLRQPARAILPHVGVMALLFAAVLFVRLLMSRLIRGTVVRRAANALLLTLCVGGMALYYAFVIIGLHYWGGVVAWNVIPTFFAQAPDLIDSLGIPRLAVGMGLATVGVGLLAAWWVYFGRFDWIADLRNAGWISALGATAGFAIMWAGIADASHAPWITEAEPVSMTLFPLAGARDIEGHPVTAENARLLDDLEDRARAAYAPAAKGATRPNLVLIVVDALRPDHMSLFGYGRTTTPYLDRLAQTGNVRKITAHAECGDTICGLLSLTGSKLPQRFSFRPFGIHEVLRRNGYRVHTILAGDHTDFYALKRYYGPVDDWFDGSSAHARFMNDDQLLIDRTATLASWDGTPAMIQYHLMSVHIMRKSDTHGEFQPSSNYMLQPSSDTGSTSETLQTATNFYDNGVVTADGVIANLLGQLKQKGYLENALVVITADHGESLGEHGLFRHANSVREELLKVPVVFIAFGYSPARSITASPYPLQIDIAPTVLAELGIPQPATWDGRPMQDAGQRPVIYFEERAFAGLIDRREPGNVWKYWIDRDDGHEHAFNLINDPHEMHEMSAIPAGQLARWRSEVLYKRD